jgi:hypothetical protein
LIEDGTLLRLDGKRLLVVIVVMTPCGFGSCGDTFVIDFLVSVVEVVEPLLNKLDSANAA